MAVLYIHLDYEGYKELEAQARAFAESTHKSTGGFYHKSLRLKIGKDMIIEFHGPLVGGYGHQEGHDHDALIADPVAEGTADASNSVAGAPARPRHR